MGMGVVVALLAVIALVLAPVARAALQPLDLRVDGGEDNWHAQRMFALRWSNPAGVAAAHYRVLDPGGQVAIGEQTIAGPATAIQHISVPPAPGAYTIELWLEDVTGTEGPPVSAKLRFDDSRPGQVEPLPVEGWIGRTAFPQAIHIGHPTGPAPVSGIRGYAVSIDTSPSGAPCPSGICSISETDLQDGVAGDSLAVEELPEGTVYVHAVAVSGAGVPSAAAGTLTLHVDKADPVTKLEGNPAVWSNQPVLLRARASDEGSGMAPSGGAMPFTAISIDGGVPTVAAGDAVSSTVISSGVHSVAFYARDAAGNVDDGGISNGRPNRPPARATVRVDREPPQLAFSAAQDPLDPELIEVRATDRHSGLDPDRGSISIRPVGSHERFAPLPTELSAAALCAHWDSGAYPAGEYEFRATAYDLAGNGATTSTRVGGTAMRLAGPLKTPVELIAPHRPRTLRYGRGAWFGGRVVVGRHSALGGAPVQIVERFETGGVPAERVSMARTDGRGRFGVHLAAGPSRRVTATVSPTRTLRGARSVPLAISVQGHLGLRVSSGVARVGGAAIVFRGKVAARDAAMPADGKVVELQFRLPGSPWRGFRTVRANAAGRFRYAYRFADDDSRGVRFQFRAYAPAQAGWPFEPAGSRPVAVQGI